MKIDFFSYEDVGASSLAYLDADDGTAQLIALMQILFANSPETRGQAIYLANSVRALYGQTQVTEPMLAMGTKSHELVSSHIEHGNELVLRNVYEAALRATGISPSRARGIAQSKSIDDLRESVISENQVRHVVPAHHTDTLVFLDPKDTGGKKYNVIVDYKSLREGKSPAKPDFHTYAAQQSDYYRRWQEQLTPAQRRSIIAQGDAQSKFMEWAEAEDIIFTGMTLRTAAALSGLEESEQKRKDIGATRLTGQESIDARRQIGTIAKAIIDAGGDLGKLATNFASNDYTPQDVALLNKAINHYQDLRKSDAYTRTVEIDPVVQRRVKTASRREAEQLRLPSGDIAVLLSAEGTGKVQATIDGRKRTFETPEDFLVAAKEAHRIDDIEFNAHIAEKPEYLLRTISILKRMGIDLSEVASVSKVLTPIIGEDVDTISVQGQTVRSGHKLGPDAYVDSIRQFDDNNAAITVQVGARYRTIMASRPNRAANWMFDNQAVTALVQRPESPRHQAMVAELPQRVSVSDALYSAALARVRGNVRRTIDDAETAVSMLSSIEDQPQVALTWALQSKTLTGFSAYRLRAGEQVYVPRSEMHFLEGEEQGRILALPAESMMSSIPGMFKSASGRWFTGRTQEKAVKLFKDLKKAARVQHRLHIDYGTRPQLKTSGTGPQIKSLSGEGEAGYTMNLALLATGALTQGMGYMIHSKGQKPYLAGASLPKTIELPSAIDEWNPLLLAGESVSVEGGRVLLGYRIDDSGERIPFYTNVSSMFDRVTLDLGKFRGIADGAGAGTKVLLPLTGYTAQMSIKEGGIKAFLRQMSYEEASAYFGEAFVKDALAGGAEALVIGSDQVKTLPRFLKALAQTDPGMTRIFESMKGATEQQIYQTTQQLLVRAFGRSVGTLRMANIGTESYMLSLIPEELRKGGALDIPFLKSRVSVPVTAEWQHGKTELNPEEAAYFQLYYPDLYKRIVAHSKQQIGMRVSALKALEIMRGESYAPGDLQVLTAAMLDKAQEEAKRLDPNAQAGDVWRVLSDMMGEGRYGIARLEGTDVILPSMQLLSQISTIKPETGNEVNPLSNAVRGLVSSLRGGAIDRRTLAIYQHELGRYSSQPGVMAQATRFEVPHALSTAFYYHPRIPEAGIALSPVDLMRMIPGLRESMAGLDLVGQLRLLRNVYGALEGEPVTYLRRPGTDPIFGALPLKIVNPFKEEGLRDLMISIAQNPYRKDVRPFVSDALYEPASADVDFDTALLALARGIKIERDKGGNYNMLKQGVEGLYEGQFLKDIRESDYKDLGAGMRYRADQVQLAILENWRERGVIPADIGSLEELLRYATLKRAQARGAKLSIDPDDTAALRDANTFRQAIRDIASPESAEYEGSQIRAIAGDLLSLESRASQAGARSKLFAAMGLDATFEEFEKRFLSPVQISQGSLEYSRAKAAMGPAFNNLRILMGAFGNALQKGDLRGADMWRAYQDIAKYSTMYQKSLDLEQLSEAEKRILSILYKRGGRTFDPFAQEWASVQGVRTVPWISAELEKAGYGKLESQFIKDVLDTVIDSIGGEYVRKLFRGINTPEAAWKEFERYGVTPAFLMAAGDTLPEGSVDALKAFEIMRSVIPGPYQELIKDIWSDVYGLPEFANEELGREEGLIPALIQPEEADLLRWYEDHPQESARMRKVVQGTYVHRAGQGTPRFQEEESARKSRELLGTISFGKKEEPPKGTTQEGNIVRMLLSALTGMEQTLVRINNRFGGGTGGRYPLNLQKQLLEYLRAPEDIEQMRYLDVQSGKQFTAMLSRSLPYASRMDRTALRQTNEMLRFFTEAMTGEVIWEEGKEKGEMGRYKKVTGPMSQRWITSVGELGERATGGGQEETIEWMMRSARLTTAQISPTSQKGVERWERDFNRIREFMHTANAAIEQLDKMPEFQGREQQLQKLRGWRDTAVGVYETMQPVMEQLELVGGVPQAFQARGGAAATDFMQLLGSMSGALLGGDRPAAIQQMAGGGGMGRGPLTTAMSYISNVGVSGFGGRAGRQLLSRLGMLYTTAGAQITTPEQEESFGKFSELFSKNIVQALDEATKSADKFDKAMRGGQYRLREKADEMTRYGEILGEVIESITSVPAAARTPVMQQRLVQAQAAQQRIEGLGFQAEGALDQPAQRNQPRALGYDIFFAVRNLRMFVDPLIRTGEQFTEMTVQMEKYRGMAGVGVNVGAIETLSALQGLQMSRARTGGYILQGARPAIGALGEQTLADVSGIGGAALGIGLGAGGLAYGLGAVAAATPIGIITAIVTAGVLGGLRLAGEVGDVEKMRAEVAGGGASIANVAYMRQQAEERMGGPQRRLTPELVAQMEAVRAESRAGIQADIAAWQRTGKITPGAFGYMTGAGGTAVGPEYQGFYGRAVQNIYGPRGVEMIMGAVGRSLDKVADITEAGTGDIVANLANLNVYGYSPEAIRQMGLAYGSAQQELGRDFARQMGNFIVEMGTPGSRAYQLAAEGLLDETMQRWMQVAPMAARYGVAAPQGLGAYAPGQMTGLAAQQYAQAISQAQEWAARGLTAPFQALTPAGGAPITVEQERLNARANATAQAALQVIQRTDATFEQWDQMLSQFFGGVGPGDTAAMQERFDIMRALGGDAWRAARLAREGALPGEFEQLELETGLAIGRTELTGRTPGQQVLLREYARVGEKIGEAIGQSFITTWTTEGFDAMARYMGAPAAPGGVLGPRITQPITPEGLAEGVQRAAGRVDLTQGTMGLEWQKLGEQIRYSATNLALRFEEFADQWEYVPQQLAANRELFELGVQRQREDMQRTWAQFDVRWQWAEEDLARQFERQMTRLDWAETDLNFAMQRAQLQGAWAQEDIWEQRRYATGRERRRLDIQGERAAIMQALGMAQMEEQRTRIDIQRQWAIEDFERERARNEIRKQWEYERLLAQQIYFEREVELRRRLMEINEIMAMNQLERQRRALLNEQAHFYAVNALTIATLRLQQASEFTNGRAAVLANTFDGLRSVLSGLSSTATNAAGSVNVLTSAISQLANIKPVLTTDTEIKVTKKQYGGPTFMPTLAMLSEMGQPEYVVPSGGALVLREPGVIELLTQIRDALRDGKQISVNVATNDVLAGYEHGMNLARELQLL